eukprot:jgi/Psemu1/26244/gm1.26244_g
MFGGKLTLFPHSSNSWKRYWGSGRDSPLANINRSMSIHKQQKFNNTHKINEDIDTGIVNEEGISQMNVINNHRVHLSTISSNQDTDHCSLSDIHPGPYVVYQITELVGPTPYYLPKPNSSLPHSQYSIDLLPVLSKYMHNAPTKLFHDLQEDLDSSASPMLSTSKSTNSNLDFSEDDSSTPAAHGDNPQLVYSLNVISSTFVVKLGPISPTPRLGDSLNAIADKCIESDTSELPVISHSTIHRINSAISPSTNPMSTSFHPKSLTKWIDLLDPKKTPGCKSSSYVSRRELMIILYLLDVRYKSSLSRAILHSMVQKVRDPKTPYHFVLRQAFSNLERSKKSINADVQQTYLTAIFSKAESKFDKFYIHTVESNHDSETKGE